MTEDEIAKAKRVAEAVLLLCDTINKINVHLMVPSIQAASLLKVLSFGDQEREAASGIVTEAEARIRGTLQHVLDVLRIDIAVVEAHVNNTPCPCPACAAERENAMAQANETLTGKGGAV